MEATTQEPDDASLVRRYVEANDRDAIALLFTRHSDMAFRTAMRVTGNASEAEDAVQSAYMRMMRDFPNYRGGHGVEVWMRKIIISSCKNLIREASRRRKREERFVEMTEGDVPDAHDEAPENLAEIIKQALHDLPEKYRLPIWLHYCEGLQFRDVAEALATPENTVRSHASRGISALRRQLATAGGAVPVSSVVAMLPSLSFESAPPLLAEVVRQAVTAAEDPGTTAAGEAVRHAHPAFHFKLAAAIAVLVAGGAITVSVWRSSTMPPAPAVLPAPLPSAPGSVFYKWDFNSGPPTGGVFQIHLGNWHYVPNGGPDGSGCMETDGSDFEATIDVPADQLPLLVRYRGAIVFRGTVGVNFAKAFWFPYGPVAQFHGVVDTPTARLAPGRMQSASAGPWNWTRNYVTDRFIDRWMGDYRIDLTVGGRIPQSRIYFKIRHPHRIDDLIIESVRLEDIPDVGPYLAAVDAISPEKRIGTVRLPQIKPGREQKEVSVEFYPASK